MFGIPFLPSLFVIPSSVVIAFGAKCCFRGFVEFPLIRYASLSLFDFLAGCGSAYHWRRYLASTVLLVVGAVLLIYQGQHETPKAMPALWSV